MNYNKPEPLSLTGNLVENLRVFRESYDIYMEETGLATTNNETKVSILLHFVGKEGLGLYNTFVFETPEDSKKIDSVIEAFEDYCKPIKNILHARNVFYKRYQKENESIEEFFSAGKTLFEDSEFGSEDETVLRDKIVMDTTDANTRNRLIEKGDVTLNEAVEALRIAEVQCRELEQMQLDEEAGNVVGVVQLKKEVGNVIEKTTKIDGSKYKIDDDNLKTEYVIKNVISILNKITPENKESLTEDFNALLIDSHEHLETIIDIVFEKAIEE
ncbi:uncharacterized protein LOC126838605 [Adelges cooleyi]|uniref:uncharacterized protein LOC126838605 n=1 Tax=Adelges cooleyi TaxID=133065 RepID=UPI0021808FC3|nr:uncharacterized protein LOC126838605 [Adelges cooleyi]XP_050429105.1 uncharacterized protein LOC126838605 [Adelges cooleyi]